MALTQQQQQQKGFVSRNCPLPQMYLQAQLFANHLRGDIALPSKQDMIEDFESDVREHLAAGKQWKHFHCIMDVQWKYSKELAELAKCTPLPDSYENMFDEVYKRRFERLTQYRNDRYEFDSNNINGYVIRQ